MPTNEQIRKLNRFDSHCQEHEPRLDKELAHIYNSAKDTGYGWKGIAEQEPELFWKAFNLIN